MNKQAGFSLLELLLVLAASSTFLFAVYQLFFHQQQQYHLQQDLLQTQENSRLALHILKNNIETAGEAGCGSLENLILHDHVGHHPRAIYEENSKIYIEKASYERSNLSQAMGFTYEPIYITQKNLFESGDILLISDCTHGDLFQVTDVNGHVLQHNGLSRMYGMDAIVARWQVDTFYFKSGLYQKTLLPEKSAIELVSGIEDVDVRYGILKNNTPVFLIAEDISDWDSVRGVAFKHFNVVLYNAAR
ncbi:MAG: prepilin-type N-terminal cleavage/methylation domain-containing protein [Legionellales bacterium]|jgi:type IV pilus assembly protein PilW